MQQTKGYQKLRGKIYGLNKEVYDNGVTRSLTLRIKTDKENSLLVQVGKWKNSKLNIKIKGDGMEKAEEFNEQEAIDKIKELFKEGDSVFINCRSDVNKYYKKIDVLVNQIYLLTEELDFDSEEFEETNELNQSVVIIEKAESEDFKVGVSDYNGNLIELDVKLKDTDVRDYMKENAKVGDLMKVSIRSVNAPRYKDSSGNGKVKARKTLKGKIIGRNSDNNNKNIDGYDNFLEIIDIDTDATKIKEYDRDEIRTALEGNAKKTNNKSTNESVEDENDLPF